jgi:hypothetical protein
MASKVSVNTDWMYGEARIVHGRGKSDPVIVAVKPTNQAERSAAESVEPRAGTKANAGQQSACRTQSRVSASQALERIRQAFAVWTRGRSGMRESCTYGSVRGEFPPARALPDWCQRVFWVGGCGMCSTSRLPVRLPKMIAPSRGMEFRPTSIACAGAPGRLGSWRD